MTIKNFALAACLAAMSATSTSAAVLIVGEETGGDVVFNLSGSYDVSAATFFSSANISTAVGGDRGVINFGPVASSSYDFYETDIFPALGFGAGATVIGGIGFGDLFALTRGGSTRLVGVEQGTTTGTVSGSLTFAGTTFAGLGLTEGVFDWAWEGDSAQLQIGTVTPVPLPAGAPLLLAGLAAFGIARRRQKAA